MGSWGVGPWDNDNAVDWQQEVRFSFDIRARWLSAIARDAAWHREVVRAAVALFQEVRRRGKWPAEHLGRDLLLARTKLAEVLTLPETAAWPDLQQAIQAELEELGDRRS